MGRDWLDGKHIGRLIEILEYARENNITYLNDGYSSKDEIKVFEGIDAMAELVRIIHPTGSIFDREKFRLIPKRAELFDIAVNQHKSTHPENYLRHGVLLHGKGAVIMSGVHTYHSCLIDTSKVKSTAVPLKKLEEMYYAPKGYTVESLDLIDLIDSDRPTVFSDDETDKYFSRVFSLMIYLVSFWWRRDCADPEWQLHYGQQVRHVSRMEMLKNILQSYKTTKAHLKIKGTYSFSRQKIMYKCIFRLTVYGSVYWRAKKILKPIGIWSILKFFKRLVKGDTAQS